MCLKNLGTEFSTKNDGWTFWKVTLISKNKIELVEICIQNILQNRKARILTNNKLNNVCLCIWCVPTCMHTTKWELVFQCWIFHKHFQFFLLNNFSDSLLFPSFVLHTPFASIPEITEPILLALFASYLHFEITVMYLQSFSFFFGSYSKCFYSYTRSLVCFILYSRFGFAIFQRSLIYAVFCFTIETLDWPKLST